MNRKRKTKKRAIDPGKAPSLKAQQQKARKLQQLVDDLERGENFNVTRLTVIKSLCRDLKTATRFTLHLARLAQKRWDWDSERKYYSAAELKQHRNPDFSAIGRRHRRILAETIWRSNASLLKKYNRFVVQRAHCATNRLY